MPEFCFWYFRIRKKVLLCCRIYCCFQKWYFKTQDFTREYLKQYAVWALSFRGFKDADEILLFPKPCWFVARHQFVGCIYWFYLMSRRLRQNISPKLALQPRRPTPKSNKHFSSIVIPDCLVEIYKHQFIFC